MTRLKEVAQQVLHALWLGWMRHAYPLIVIDATPGLEADLKLAQRKAMDERAHAIRCERDASHYAAEAVRLSHLAVRAREDARTEEERADRAEELVVEVRSCLHGVTPGSEMTVDDAIDLIDNYMNESEAK